jgi:type II secretory pathway component GspD/PulD (secretin)
MSGPNSVTKEEAIDILNLALRDNGYVAMPSSRTLHVTTVENARIQTPVIRGRDVPKKEDAVTQIIPIDYIGAAQLMNNLIPLLPPTTQVTANEGANAIIITDSQINIRRAVDIIAALDLPADSRVVVKVKLMKFADAKNVAQIIKDLFTQDQQRNANQPGRINFGGGGGRGGGGMAGMLATAMGGAAGGQSGPSANPRAPVARVNATSDDRANAVIVSAPEDVMPTIETVLDQIDTDVEDVTELRAFILKNADPVETCDLLLNIFPDDTRNDQSQQRGARMVGGRGGGMGGGMMSAASTGSSDHMKKMGRVLAVAEPRTGSVIVSASHDMMIQIAALIEQIDASDRRHQKVFVYQLRGNVQQAAQMLQDMLGSTTSRNNNNNTDPLQSRQQANAQNMSRNTGTSTSIGSSGSNRSIGGSSGSM